MRENEPQHDKTSKLTWVPSKDSDQTGRTGWASDQSSLCTLWVEALVHVGKDLNLLQEDSEGSDQTGWGTQVILLVLSYSCSNVVSFLKYQDPSSPYSQTKEIRMPWNKFISADKILQSLKMHVQYVKNCSALTCKSLKAWKCVLNSLIIQRQKIQFLAMPT